MHCKVGEKDSQCVRQTLGLTGVTPVIRGSWVGSAVTVEMMMEYVEPGMNCDFQSKFGALTLVQELAGDQEGDEPPEKKPGKIAEDYLESGCPVWWLIAFC